MISRRALAIYAAALALMLVLLAALWWAPGPLAAWRQWQAPPPQAPNLDDVRAIEPALDILAGWLASRINGPVQRAVGELKVELVRASETITLSRPQNGVTATLTRTSKPEAKLPLARRETRDCLAEDMRRLDADEIYLAALKGIDEVEYV